ncbi:MAG: hypothetical protein H7Y42_14255 [Chitinophagaceae bacterium]|nr:hypothetical protein [Chitinophagaceae bacterium]
MKQDLIVTRRWIIFFMITLFLSGLTAIPAETGLQFLSRCFPVGTEIGNWLDRVYIGVSNTNRDYPFIAYGYDWLAFAHFVLAILFIGPLRDPVKNRWVIEFGMIACLLIIPYALIAGQLRGIPFWWRIIDCSFGVIGLIPLGICLKRITNLESHTLKTQIA